MTCADFRDRLDRSGALRPRGVDAVAHMARCPACRSLAERERSALDLYRLPPADGNRDFARSIMEVLPYLPRPRREVGMREWAMVGFALVSSVVVAAASVEVGSANTEYGASYVLPMGLVFGVALTVYGLAFISSHLAELSKTFGLRERTH